jgi:MFS superfamily sulfate permease-like transporter
MNRPPSWKTAIQRGGLAAGVLFALLVIAFKANAVTAIPLAALAALLYIPGFHLTDTLLYRARQRRQARERERQQDAQ